MFQFIGSAVITAIWMAICIVCYFLFIVVIMTIVMNIASVVESGFNWIVNRLRRTMD